MPPSLKFISLSARTKLSGVTGIGELDGDCANANEFVETSNIAAQIWEWKAFLDFDATKGHPLMNPP